MPHFWQKGPVFEAMNLWAWFGIAFELEPPPEIDAPPAWGACGCGGGGGRLLPLAWLSLAMKGEVCSVQCLPKAKAGGALFLPLPSQDLSAGFW